MVGDETRKLGPTGGTGLSLRIGRIARGEIRTHLTPIASADDVSTIQSLGSYCHGDCSLSSWDGGFRLYPSADATRTVILGGVVPRSA